MICNSSPEAIAGLEKCRPAVSLPGIAQIKSRQVCQHAGSELVDILLERNGSSPCVPSNAPTEPRHAPGTSAVMSLIFNEDAS